MRQRPALEATVGKGPALPETAALRSGRPEGQHCDAVRWSHHASTLADDCTDIAVTASIRQSVVPSGLFIAHTTPAVSRDATRIARRETAGYRQTSQNVSNRAGILSRAGDFARTPRRRASLSRFALAARFRPSFRASFRVPSELTANIEMTRSSSCPLHEGQAGAVGFVGSRRNSNWWPQPRHSYS